MYRLMIHADPGARSAFLAAWLTDCLNRQSFDVGRELHPGFYKMHQLITPNDIKTFKDFNGIKIRIRPSFKHIDLLSLLFLRKNVYPQIPEFTHDEYSLDTFTKLVRFSEDIFRWDSELDYSWYDHVIDFQDLYDTNFMKQFYTLINGKTVSDNMINILEQTNKINTISIDKNHACSILKLTLMREFELGLKEQNRFWSIVDIYRNTPCDQLYDTVYNSIKPENYNILL
jgi:hypothetical protein